MRPIAILLTFALSGLLLGCAAWSEPGTCYALGFVAAFAGWVGCCDYLEFRKDHPNV